MILGIEGPWWVQITAIASVLTAVTLIARKLWFAFEAAGQIRDGVLELRDIVRGDLLGKMDALGDSLTANDKHNASQDGRLDAHDETIALHEERLNAHDRALEDIASIVRRAGDSMPTPIDTLRNVTDRDTEPDGNAAS